MDEADYFRSLLGQTSFVSQVQHEAAMARIAQEQEYSLFAQLRPRLFRDGNHWCVLYGDNIQVGVAGFGDTPQHAIWHWNKQWTTSSEDKEQP